MRFADSHMGYFFLERSVRGRAVVDENDVPLFQDFSDEAGWLLVVLGPCKDKTGLPWPTVVPIFAIPAFAFRFAVRTRAKVGENPQRRWRGFHGERRMVSA